MSIVTSTPAMKAYTPYHARYLALRLTQRASEVSVERFLPALASANIDLHPHQIDAALFASRSQFRDGVILADEEGLGKTIEAGIALLQAHIEGKKHLLVLCPPTLIPHWRGELEEKFGLSPVVLQDVGREDGVVLISYPEAYRKADQLAAIPWDLCVLDEAHQLANAGLSDHVLADSIRAALAGRRKILLTATPMQNSLLDLYYLIRFLDETAFGSEPEVFRRRYMGNKPLKQELAARSQMICQRTLKRQALTMRLPDRAVRTISIQPTLEEAQLSERMSLYFHREHLAAFPKIQEHYIRLTYWKLLASSTAALHDALLKLMRRLKALPGTEDEQSDIQALLAQAAGIRETARSQALLAALPQAMGQLKEAGAPQKAVIFSENRQTLAFLDALLSGHGYRGKIVHYDTPNALSAFEKGGARILLATDRVGVGVNLSHCALVINYDLPWNVQKLEQRISRCHRYGQKHDVLVLNFIDPSNRADRRLYELLNRKLKAFDDVFGASEGVLASAREAVRSTEEIQGEQADFEQANQQEIQRRKQKAEADLLAHFDEEVSARFIELERRLPQALEQMEHWLWEITRHKLHHRAVLDDDKRSIIVDKPPYKGLRLTRMSFGMDRTLPRGERYRLDHPLAKRVIEDCLQGDFGQGQLVLAADGVFVSGMSGEMALWQYAMLSSTSYQTVPVLCGVTKDGRVLTPEDCERVLSLPVLSFAGGPVWRDEDDERPMEPLSVNPLLTRQQGIAIAELRDRALLESNAELEMELTKLRRYADDELAALSFRLEAMQADIRSLESSLNEATGFAERFERNKALASLEKQRREEEARQRAVGMETLSKRDAMMAAAREKQSMRAWDTLLFVVSWRIE